MTYYATRSSPGAGDWIFGAVRRNPEGLLLLAAGCALLMRTSSRPSHQRTPGDSKQWESAAHPAEKKSSIGESVAKAGRNAGDYLSDVAETVSETAGAYTSTVSDYADDAMQAVSEQSRHFARQAQSSFESTTEYVLERQPLAIAVIGLAAGAAAAAAFAPTEIERRALGPTGDRLRDAAGEVGERLKEAGAKAGERLMSVAEDRGLNAEGLRDAARDVGETFGAAMAGGESSDRQSDDNNQRSEPKDQATARGGPTQAAQSRPPAGGSKRSQ